jgi:hypothetical protein
MKALFNAVDDYFQMWDVAMIFSIPAALGILLANIFSRPTFLAVGGLFFRTSDLLKADGLTLIASLLGVIFSLTLISATVILVSLLVKEKRTFTHHRKRIYRERLEKDLLPITAFFLILFALNFILQALSLAVPLLGLFHLVSLSLYILTFFIPYGVIIDKYDLDTALVKSTKLALRYVWRPLVWIGLIFSLLIIGHAFSLLVFGYNIGELISYLISSLIILPFSIFFAAHLYMDKYPLS